MRRAIKSRFLDLIKNARYDAIPSKNPIGAALPTEPIGPALPTEPIGPALPTEPIGPALPTEPIPTALSEWDFARMLPARLPLRAFVNGFPGAGNVILQHVSTALVRSVALDEETARSTYLTPALGSLGPRYNLLMNILSQCCPAEWRGNCYFNVHRGGGIVDFVSSNSAEHFLYAGPFDLSVYLNSDSYSSHELPTRAAYELYASYGHVILPIVRHPLDILVSLAGKSPLSLREEEAIQLAPDGAERRQLEQTIRRRATHARLNNTRWLRLAALALTEFFHAQAEMQGKARAVRFEDMLCDPAAFVRSLSARLGLDISTDRIDQIAGDIGTAHLAPGHFHHPSVGKWRRSFTASRLHFLEGLKLFDAAEEVGYPRPAGSQLLGASFAKTRGAQPQEEANDLRFLEFQYFAQTFDPRWVAYNAGLDEVKFTQAGVVRMFGSDQSVLDHFREKLVLTALKLQGTAVGGNVN